MQVNSLGFLLLLTFYLQVSCYPSFLSPYTYKLFAPDTTLLLQNSTDLTDSQDFLSLNEKSIDYQFQEPTIDYSDLDDIESIDASELEAYYDSDLEYDLDEAPASYAIILAHSNSTESESENLGSDYLNKKLEDHESDKLFQESYDNAFFSDNNTTNTTIIITTSQHFPLDSDLDDFERELKQVLSENTDSDYDDIYEGESYIYVEYDLDEDEYYIKYYNTTQIEIEQRQKEILEEEDEDEDDEEDSVSDSSSAWDV